MAETQIYYLEDESGNIFYVGATKQKDLRNRRKLHKFRFKKECKIHLLDKVNEATHPQNSFFEAYWIQQMISWGFTLINQYKTARGYIAPPEHRKNLSQKAIQQWEDGRGHHPKQTKGGM